ncbi:hypothetical protein EDD86DRAFT_249035 [Gorgonomyces haynaldii]|nr:hypothetical protein EDD86DRAFT_249035 [Gorgonomyces haynaldii]
MPSTIEKRLVRLGCVPEHFSTPLYLQKHMDKHALGLDIVSVPQGTGEAIEITPDAPIAGNRPRLVARICKHLIDGKETSRLLGSYTQSPLKWSLAVKPQSRYQQIRDLDAQGTRIGISRYGSGSHIMAIVMNTNYGFKHPFEFVVLDNFQGLRDGIETEKCDAFMWEVVTTKPWYDNQTLRMLDIVSCPWPSFSIASQTEIPGLQEGIDASIQDFVKGFETQYLDYVLQSQVFHYPNKQDVMNWFRDNKFTLNVKKIQRKDLRTIVDSLKQSGILNQDQLKDYELKHGPIEAHLVHPSVILE